MTDRTRPALAILAAFAAGVLASPALGQQSTTKPHSDVAQSVVHGAPTKPALTWSLAAGGRIYDNWWDALDKKKPAETHPAYPESGPIKGANTWRCKECHGWDYRGRDGEYKSGGHATGIKGIRGAVGRDPKKIVTLLRAKPHGYTPEILSDDELMRIALFVSKGQHDTTRVMNAKTGKVNGDPARGKAVFQTTCAVCHGYDGRLLNWGTKDEPEYMGTAANKFPFEVLHKIRNSHPGAQMIALRAFALQDSIDLLAYARSLPVK